MYKCHKASVKKSLRVSTYDGICASVMIGFTQDYFIPFLLVLGGTAKQVALLTALPNFFASIIQIKTADFAVRLKSRKKVFLIFVFLQTLTILPMAFIAFLNSSQIVLYITAVVCFTICGAFSLPAWSSLMADYIEHDKRGAYFGWRNKITGFVMMGAAFVAGCVLHGMKNVNVFFGFGVIFIFAFIFRLISWYFLMQMYELPVESKKESYFSFFDFISRLKTSNFAKFVMFGSMMTFSVNIAAPYFSVFMLRDLKFSYLLYTVVTVSATLTIYALINRWGRHADHIGNLKVIKFTAPCIAIVPLLWIFNRHPLFLIVTQICSGFAWAGFNIATNNFIYDAVSPEKRTRCIAYFNMFNGLALCFGALVGGFLLQYLPPLCGYKLLTLFLISSLLRIIVSLVIPQKLKEVRPVKHVDHDDLFLSVIGFKPLPVITKSMVENEV